MSSTPDFIPRHFDLNSLCLSHFIFPLFLLRLPFLLQDCVVVEALGDRTCEGLLLLSLLVFDNILHFHPLFGSTGFITKLTAKPPEVIVDVIDANRNETKP